MKITINVNMIFIPPELQDKDKSELLEYYDNPKNFFIPDNTKEIEKLDNILFPKHATVLLTHGIFSINSEKRNEIAHHLWANKEQVYRLLKNFSDWWTRKVINRSFIPKENIIIPKSPRLEWDPARAIDSDDAIRSTDFNNNQLLPEKTIKTLKSEWSLWQINHKEYHWNIAKKLWTIEADRWGSITWDIHDTWVNMMNINPQKDSFREGWYPKMEIGTLEWDSCNQEILDFFVKQVEKYFWFTPTINQKYKWWYVTQVHGKKYRGDKNTRTRNLLQIELGRYLYMKESTQTINWEQAEKVGVALRLCIQKTAEEFDQEYFKNISEIEKTLI